jgi:hypothetical protein
MTNETLSTLNDEELQQVIEQSHELLKQRDKERKEHALVEARTLLSSVGEVHPIVWTSNRGNLRSVRITPFHTLCCHLWLWCG